METSPYKPEVRQVDRVFVVDTLSTYGETRLLDFIDLNDEGVVAKICELAREWNVAEDVLLDACLIPKYGELRKNR